LLEWSRVLGPELMPRLVVGDAERCCGKLKSWKGFLKPNFELGPNRSCPHHIIAHRLDRGPYRFNVVVDIGIGCYRCLFTLQILN
jgi:hypothetical protein